MCAVRTCDPLRTVGAAAGERPACVEGAAQATRAAIIGSVILSEAARSAHRRNHASDWARCESNYRSFEPNTGMDTGYDGVRRTCPYLE